MSMKIGWCKSINCRSEFSCTIGCIKNAGCDEIYEEKKSGVAEREALEKALGVLREGDTFSSDPTIFNRLCPFTIF